MFLPHRKLADCTDAVDAVEACTFINLCTVLQNSKSKNKQYNTCVVHTYTCTVNTHVWAHKRWGGRGGEGTWLTFGDV